MVDIAVIDNPAAAVVALDPMRSRLLALLEKPGSAASLAEKVKLPRQKVNYHLKTLEAHGLIRVAEERRWGGLTERLMIASASSYVVSPEALGNAGSDPGRITDRLSAGYAIALAARIIREVGALFRRSQEMGKALATLSIDTEIRFASAEKRAEFTAEIQAAIIKLAAKYHDQSAPGGRWHRLLIVAHPSPHKPMKSDLPS